MKKVYVFFGFLFLIPFVSNGQLTITPNPHHLIDIDFSAYDVVAKGYIKNGSTRDKTLVWERTEYFLAENWSTAVCDVNLCYLPHVGTQEFTLEAGKEGTLDLHLYPKDTEGSGLVKITVYDKFAPLDSVSVLYYLNETTSTVEKINNNIKIVPNPSVDRILISDFEKVDALEFYSMEGKLISRNKLTTGEINVNFLSTGVYILRMVDKSGRYVSSNVLVKK